MASAIDEVVRQHVFIEAWLAGTAGEGSSRSDAWQQFADVLDDRFVIVPPSGVAEPKATLLTRFHAAFGTRPGVEVEIRDAQPVYRAPGLEVVRYEEWQSHETHGNRRVSTAVMVGDDAMPCGWRWIALHETALP